MGLLRLLLIAGLVYLGYRVVKAAVAPSPRVQAGGKAGEIDEMVQDPQCRTYVPRREAVRRSVGGRDLYFCSAECAAEFEKASRSGAS